MPVWSEILGELPRGSHLDPLECDRIRRKYLRRLSKQTQRDTILYASSWVQRPEAPPALTSIVDEDIQALMEVTSDIRGPSIDLILHSPGGSVEAAEAIVEYLRSRFEFIRVIVPNLAMSAATMIACAANEICMGKHSFLGPTDPQFFLPTPIGPRQVAAQAVLQQFEMAKAGSIDQAERLAWNSLILQLGPDLIAQCENAVEMSRMLVRSWLRNYMFMKHDNRVKLSYRISNWLADHSKIKSHGRHLPRKLLIEKGLVIKELEKNKVEQDLSLSVFHAATILFSMFKVGKIVENQYGRAFIRSY